ncbi:hypothetical protein [Nonomuraea rhodomycinica]|uniref:Uncharacterized protein n=1 Tax=Nonomuraea rhodomycinica TaxID=1712872 RepID=A0A7Y6IRI5_9ACTN|nr:hypothetical protein [Nonomuraea rhodomycinica]NUW43076.1 hypothetical protein [Nonomuraea rhodomycinica]
MTTVARSGTPASPPKRSRIGDLRMRDVYRGLAVVAAAAAVAAGVVFVLPSGPDEVAAGPVAAPPAQPSSSGAAVQETPTVLGTTAAPSDAASALPSDGTTAPPSGAVTAVPEETSAAVPTLAVTLTATVAAGAPATDAPTPGPSGVAATAPPTAPSTTLTPSPLAATGRPVPTPGTTLAPGYTAMEALYADARLPRLPAKARRVPLKAAPGRTVKDRRSGVVLPRLAKPWKTYGPAPFTTRQVLPQARGSRLRGMFVTCPLPIEEQKAPRDSALLAARWTLNHHPKGATITWLASQPVKKGWLLMYRVKYGRHSSRAAVVVLDGGMPKPALAFVTVPDTQRKRWSDVTRVISGVRVLG